MKLNKRILSLILAVVMVLGMVPMATAADDAAATCTECGSVGGHTLGCSQFVIPTCEECHGDLLGEKAGHSTACSQYVAPETTPAPASEEGTEGTTAGTTVATTTGTTESTTEGTTVATTVATTEGATEGTTAPSTEATTAPSTETTEATTEATISEEDAEAIAEINELMDEFVELVNIIPETDSVKAFMNALNHYAAIRSMMTRDSLLPENEVEAYEAAYRNFAEAMGYEASAIEVTFPDSMLEMDLKSLVSQAKNLLDCAQELYKEIGHATSVTEICDSYSVAANKLTDILQSYPELGENPLMMFAADLGNGVSTVETVAENIEMHLYNYGPKINNNVSDYGFMPFIHSEGTYGWAVDSSGNKPSAAAGGWPTLNTTLSGVPVIKTNGTNDVIKAGALNRLFDPNYSGTDRIDAETYKNNLLSAEQNPYQYGSVHFEVNNDDGSGTGLFQKDGDYFIYDSGKNAAWFNTETGKFEVYNYVVRPAYTVFSTSATNGNFLPFNQGHTAGREDYQAEKYTKKYTYTNDAGTKVEATASIAKEETVTTKPSGARTAYRLYGNSRATEVDLWFGLQMEFDFYQPEDGSRSGEPMIFDFYGDDDVFVYIDNVLILDIGGTHGAQAGFINFATGEVTNPESYGQYGTAGLKSSTLYDLMKREKGSSLDDSIFIDSNNDGELDTFADFTKHNLKFYYLERGGNISYCRLKFNMDPLPKGYIAVQKDVPNINAALRDDQTYTFTVDAQHNTPAEVASMKYEKRDVTTNELLDTVTVANGGTFTLTDGQKAEFSLPEGTTVTFTEAENTATRSVRWKKDGIEVDQATVTIGNGTDSAAAFICENTRKTNNLSITKSLTDEFNSRLSADTAYTVQVKIKDAAYTGDVKIGATTVKASADGKFTIKANENAIIENIPTGYSYEVVEIGRLDTDGEEYFPEGVTAPAGFEFRNVAYENESGTLNAEVIAKVKNTIVAVYGHLTITKDGIDAKDHHEGTTANGEEVQSSSFNIYGESAAGETINLDVTIPGKGSVTIKNIPVGNYTVTEKENWSWRYKADDATKPAAITGGNTTEVGFNNTRNKDLWLSGDNYVKNSWNATSRQDYWPQN